MSTERSHVVKFIKTRALNRLTSGGEGAAVASALMFLASDIEDGKHIPPPLPRSDAVVDSQPGRCPTENDEGRCIYSRGHKGGCDTENK